MQKTRLNTLYEIICNNLSQTFSNPWRNLFLNLTSILAGFFIGQAIATIAGQESYWEITVGIILLIFTEVSSKVVYSKKKTKKKILWLETFNFFKMGIIYSLYIEALKLGS
ncbi:DUF565 domain-containing protein [Candidatus Atelocyanobacterium thalassae]|uniref:Uncharacterized protein n=2 Tax=Candidatus Atelocyanobacterium thalassae TaxID=713887 RepID=A0A086CGY8_9CHRO|nr:DUF565 domain-containing protein [Candidatus Atelocyanobacterium thalassa]KFF41452.1 MAG: Protein of unknown function (DUF565) [Candidatus Atelocyanobacterium thalassa isolate SIO64986]BDA39653.1 hypothetical protein CPARK_000049200 [cyanobacterium endosymbiont of Braarudosphaera bigelowii]